MRAHFEINHPPNDARMHAGQACLRGFGDGDMATGITHMQSKKLTGGMEGDKRASSIKLDTCVRGDGGKCNWPLEEGFCTPSLTLEKRRQR